MDKQQKSRISSLDGLRGTAAVIVMIFHFDYFFAPQGSFGAWLPFLNRAYLGVDLFFLLSGFVMAHVYGQELSSNPRGEWVNFARVRFARIYPLYAITTLAMVVTHAVSRMPLPPMSFSGWSLALQLFLLQFAGKGASWNYPGWSIGTEAVAYVFFVFAARELICGKFPRLMAIACIATVLTITLANGGFLNIFAGHSAVARTLAEFSAGVLIYRAHVADPIRSRRWAGWLSLALIAAAVWSNSDFFVVCAFAALIYYSVNGSNAVRKALDTRPAVLLGEWSYSIYLWHAPVHYAVMAASQAAGHPIERFDAASARIMILVLALAVIGLSAFSYRYIEVSMRRWLLSALPAPMLRMDIS